MTEQISIPNGVVFMEPGSTLTPSEKMTEEPGTTAVPRQKKPLKRAKPRDTGEASIDFLMKAKLIVVDNYNEHRNDEILPAITVDMVNIVWFSKTLGNWKAVVASPVARGLLWEISYNGVRNELYLDVYKKLKNTTKIPQEM